MSGIWPGDILEGEDGHRFEIQRLVAYQGREDCLSPTCTRDMRGGPPGRCVGWHCSLCDEPCSSMGHKCPRAQVER